MKNQIRMSTFWRALTLLPKVDRNKLLIATGLQVFGGLLDLLGVGLLGIVGALAVTGMESRSSGNRVNSILNLLHLTQMTLQSKVTIIGGLAALVLILRTLFSVYFTRKILFFLSTRSALAAKNLVGNILAQPIALTKNHTTQQFVFSVTWGVRATILGIIGSSINLVADLFLTLILLTGLFIVDPGIALLTLLMFGSIGFGLYKILNQRARNLGIQEATLSVKTQEQVSEVLNAYKEIVSKHRQGYYFKQIGESIRDLSHLQAELAFMPNVSKFVIEGAIVFSTLIVSAIQFTNHDSSRAVATLAVFMGAGSRIAPAVMRIQQNLMGIKGNIGVAKSTIELNSLFISGHKIDENIPKFTNTHNNFVPNLELKNVSYQYPGSDEYAIRDLSLIIKPGEFTAIVGDSGAGKTTLADLILGVAEPDSGEIKISNLLPREAIKCWPGAIGYVPQEVFISNSTVLKNVALGYKENEVPKELIYEALDLASLSSFVKESAADLDLQTGERGSKLSGGQRQRLGIARALVSNPLLIVLDEATSALDGMTESEITSAISDLAGKVTVIVIAHRLATIRSADKVIYLEKGKKVAEGTFEELKNLVPKFKAQAEKMGL